MITLFIDTSTGPGGIALTRDGQLLAESVLNMGGKRQNGWLLPELERLLALCGITTTGIDLFACSTGPGAFTGIRTAVATVQGLALATGKPCIGISSLAQLAMNLPRAAVPVCVMLDARKNEVYCGLYRTDRQPENIIQDQAVRPEAILSQLSGPTLFVGDGAQKYRDLIQNTLTSQAIFADDCHHTPRPACGIVLAEAAFANGLAVPPEQLLPNYLRLSEAELLRQKHLNTAALSH